MKRITTDIAIIGSGIAGLAYALKTAAKRPDLQISIFTKDANNSNTTFAQGGLAVVNDFKFDSFEKHIEDTIMAGHGLCNRDIVEMVVKKAPQRLEELINWGISLDKNEENQLDLALEGGHSRNRIVHHKDKTGAEIISKLMEKIKQFPNISLFSQHFAIDLVAQPQTGSGLSGKDRSPICSGVDFIDQQRMELLRVNARITVLATGGIGQLYFTTTNPEVATADGIAMAWRAGATLADMEYVQFHPTALYHTERTSAFLISEALRGAGAWVVNKHGRRFLFDYDQRGELASRDIISSAISKEMEKSGSNYVFLYCCHMDKNELNNHFPTIVENCRLAGYDINTDALPICPAAHYLCGGIKTDKYARTGIKYLYALGECAHTGLHGANRLASNSLIEALVFAHEAMLSSICEIDGISPTEERLKVDGFKKKFTNEEPVWLTDSKQKLQRIMSQYAGVIKNQEGLTNAMGEIIVLENKFIAHYDTAATGIKALEFQNMLQVARIILKQSIFGITPSTFNT